MGFFTKPTLGRRNMKGKTDLIQVNGANELYRDHRKLKLKEKKKRKDLFKNHDHGQEIIHVYCEQQKSLDLQMGKSTEANTL